MQSLPLIPDSVLAESTSMWSKRVERSPTSAGKAGAGAASGLGRGATCAARRQGPATAGESKIEQQSWRGRPRMHAGKHLSSQPLRQLVTDYQQYTRHHCRKIVAEQVGPHGRAPGGGR